MAESAVRLAYDYAGAGEQISQSEDTIRRACDRGELRRVFPNSKPLILHTDLVEWLESLPETAPPKQARKK